MARVRVTVAVATILAWEAGVMAVNAQAADRYYGEPIPLRGDSIYFTSWRFVRQGQFSWVGGTGGSLWDSDGSNGARYVSRLMPRGVRLQTQPAAGRIPLDFGGSVCGIEREGPGYRAWYMVEGTQDRIMRGYNWYVAYAESVDGERWIRPVLNSNDSHRIVLRGDLDGSARGCHAVSVFTDPTSAAERYKMFYYGIVTEAEVAAFTAKYPGEVDPMAHRTDVRAWFGLFGAVSSNGLAWTILPGPLAICHADTHNTCSYDLDRGCYVAYVRAYEVPVQAPGWERNKHQFASVGRRAIGRMTSKDFRHFSPAEVVMSTRADMPPNQLWYTNGKTTLPGCPDQHVMFPWRWDLATDSGDCWLLSSPEGETWSQVPGPAVVTRGPPGARDSGYVVATPPLIELPDNRWAVPYNGYPIPHKYPGRDPEKRQFLNPGVRDVTGYAVWPKGRLVALVADDEGEFATPAMIHSGTRLRLNARMRTGGHIRVSVRLYPDGVLRDWSEPITGDGLDLKVTWRGTDTADSSGTPRILCFRMKAAELFGVTFE